MAISKYVSDIKYIYKDPEKVFSYLSDFENLSKFLNEGMLQKVSEQIPQVSISDFESDHDSCRFKISGFGMAEVKIVNREPFKTIKIESAGKLPLSFTFWIQLLPYGEYQSKIRLTLHADMSMMIKMVAGKKLDAGINQLADTLAGLPY
ncbi:hypothetical protein MNBD_BACTEROID01-302 [hydrothermal vent metagenome]|uniref:Polyketide cyclase n=1 Tax=hydrothermal vent metagenome TaxID=652676 RepID=A0A3B0U0J4_9ZZZZ